MSIKELQIRLSSLGFDPGPPDGVFGNRTLQATLAALDKYHPVPTILEDTPWIAIARKYIGVQEFAGPHNNPHILKWWKNMGSPFQDDETPWCGGFVGGVLFEVGIKPAKNGAMARAWNSFGKKLTKPAVGCIVVFWRGSKTGTAGHVGFCLGRDQHGNLMILGGNQGNAVNVKPFSKDRVLGYRWPGVAPREERYNLPIINSDGRVSTEEG